MKTKLILLGLISTALIVSAKAYNGGTYYGEKEQIKLDIPMDAQQVYRGQNTLRLKALAKRHHPNVNLKEADLKRVVLRAKSRAGRAQVTATEGYFESRMQIIGKSHKEQGFQKPGGFQRVVLETPREMHGVKWQAHMRGNVKIKKIRLVLDVPVKQQKVKAQCTAEMRGIFGQVWDSFSAQAQGKNKNRAKAKACKKAIAKCEARVDELQSFIPEIANFVGCVNK